MSRGTTNRKYTREFKSEAVRLSQKPGMGVRRAAADLGIPMNCLYRWKQSMEAEGDDALRGHGKRTAADERIVQLERRVAELTMERDILKKAAVWFARQQL